MKRVTLSRLFVPHLFDVLFIALFITVLLLGSRLLNTDGDLGRHLTLGQYILNSSQIPVNNILSFTKVGDPRPPYEWLAQVLFALAYRLLLLDGVVLFSALVISAAFLVLYVDSLKRNQAPVLSLFVTLTAAVASSLHWLARPHIFTFLFLAIWIFLLERVRTGRPVQIWQFPLLMAVWVNTHGGFIFGFLAWGAYLAGWIWSTHRRPINRSVVQNLLIVGVSSLVATVLTPDLWHNWDAVLGNRSLYLLSRTVETRPPNFASPTVWPFLFLLILIVIFCLLLRKQAVSAHIFLLSGFGILAISMARNIPLFAIAAVPILVEWIRQSLLGFHPWLKLEEKFAMAEKEVMLPFWSTLVLLAAIVFFTDHINTTRSSVYQFNPSTFPVAAVDWIESHPQQGRMFNDFNWGGYLLYRLWPSQKVFIDSQSDFYGEDFVRRYEEIATGASNWEAELTQFDVNWIIVSPRSGLAGQVRADPGWITVYEDSLAIICARK